ncbi:MAG TPA: DUF4190 domain-containing protein [Firmicutes bacterium]|nr:DUF4190 domain-containing protein [Bacillota bacterium]
MFCQNCGMQLNGDEERCPACGAAVDCAADAAGADVQPGGYAQNSQPGYGYGQSAGSGANDACGQPIYDNGGQSGYGADGVYAQPSGNDQPGGYARSGQSDYGYGQPGGYVQNSQPGYGYGQTAGNGANNVYGQPSYGYGQPGGYPQQYRYDNYGYGASKPANGLAIAGFVCSFFVALVGLILSIVGLNKSKELQGSGKGLAIAGIALSAAWMVFAVIIVIVYFTTDLYYYY